jgi:hypothetical protein
VDASLDFGGNAELGRAIFALRRGTDLVYIDSDGSELEPRPLPALSLAPYPSWATFAIEPNGGLFIGESGMRPSDSGKVSHLLPGWPDRIRSDIDLEFDGNAGGGSIIDVRADATGGAYVLGSLHSVRDTGAGTRLDYGAPFASHINAQGGVDYTFTNDEVISEWAFPQRVWNDDGELYLLTVEDPIEFNYPAGADKVGLCSVWGCSAFALHKLLPTGAEQWRYEHRKHSATSAIALSTTGVVIVAGGELREKATGFLALFSTE